MVLSFRPKILFCTSSSRPSAQIKTTHTSKFPSTPRLSVLILHDESQYVVVIVDTQILRPEGRGGGGGGSKGPDPVEDGDNTVGKVGGTETRVTRGRVVWRGEGMFRVGRQVKGGVGSPISFPGSSLHLPRTFSPPLTPSFTSSE